MIAEICKKIGITANADIERIEKIFKEEQMLNTSLNDNPYIVYCTVLDFQFPFADKLVAENFPQFENSKERCSEAMRYVIEAYCNATGSTKLNASDMYKWLYKCIGNCSSFAIECCKDDMFVYKENTKEIGLKSLFKCEANISNAIKKRLEIHNNFNVNINKFSSIDGIDFTDEQLSFLKLAMENGVCILNGSAGCGKSTTVKALTRLLDTFGESYSLLAPTGIAAKRLKEVTGKNAYTIHKYLLMDKEPIDYLIIDEFSMLGVELFCTLLGHNSILPDTRFVFVCDEAQLPSISVGNIIHDLLANGKIPMVRLTKVFRYGENGVATIATDIRNGNMPNMDKEWEDTFCYETDKPQHDLLYCINDARKNYGIDDILILTPKKIGEIGTYRLNAIIQEWENKNGKDLKKFGYIIKEKGTEYSVNFRIGDKVINIKNNYHASTENGNNAIVMNGEIGKVLGEKKGDMLVDFGDKTIAYSKKEIRNLQLAYALTVHKCQGQEAKCVVFIATDSDAFMLTRNLMYVAVSRAKERLYIICNETAIANGVKKESTNDRKTWLGELLNES